MIRNAGFILVVMSIVLVSARSARAQHLWWDPGKQKAATCVYGEITVLATQEETYYCGINWHPGEPAGGYCGIQHNDGDDRHTNFSIWDTTEKLHPEVTRADPLTDHGRFTGEGKGAHTMMPWPWKVNETFQYYLTKKPGKGDSTDVAYYVFDRETMKWINCATISCPNGGKKEVGDFSSGGMDAFLENYGNQDVSSARLAVYRLWLGTNPDNLKAVTYGEGDGKWGILHNEYFLAYGSAAELDAVFAKLQKEYGKPTFGSDKTKLHPIPDRAMPPKSIEELKQLPKAPAV